MNRNKDFEYSLQDKEVYYQSNWLDGRLPNYSKIVFLPPSAIRTNTISPIDPQLSVNYVKNPTSWLFEVQSSTRRQGTKRVKTFQEKYPNIAEEIEKIWKTAIIPSYYFEHDIFFKLLDELTILGPPLTIEPVIDQTGKFKKFVFYYGNLAHDQWNEAENKIGQIAHEFYNRFGHPVLRIIKLIDIEGI